MPTVLYKISLRGRIWVSFVILLVLSIGTAGTATYFIAATAMQKTVVENSQSMMGKSSQVLDENFNKMLVSFLALMVSAEFKNMLGDIAKDEKNTYFTHLNAMQTMFSMLKINQNLVESVLISTPIGDFYPTDHLLIPNVSFKQTELYRQIQGKQDLVFIEGHADPFFGGNERVVSMVMQPIATRELSVHDVYVIVNLKERALAESITKNVEGSNISYYLISKEGSPVIQYPQQMPWFQDERFLARIGITKSGHFDYRYNDEDYSVAYSKLLIHEDWIIVGMQSKKQLLGGIQSIRWVTFAIIIICILLSLLLSHVLTRFLLVPLRDLQIVMKKVAGNDLSARFHSRFQDEIASVGQQFNRMLEEVNRLIREVEEVASDKQKAEVKALQAQIDPHFLYNSLNTIYWKAYLNKIDDVKEMILSLSKLFQLGLNNGKEITTLDKEISHVTQYLQIQKKCYNNLFTYKVLVEGPTLALTQPILKLLLQPLVENSVLHGFKDLAAGGIIEIHVYETPEAIMLKVIDNGVGFDVRTVADSLQTEVRPTNGGYALKNVYDRLKLYYGSAADLLLESSPGITTSVTLRIPKTMADDEPTGEHSCY